MKTTPNQRPKPKGRPKQDETKASVIPRFQLEPMMKTDLQKQSEEMSQYLYKGEEIVIHGANGEACRVRGQKEPKPDKQEEILSEIKAIRKLLETKKRDK